MTPPPDHPAPDAETLRKRLRKVRKRLQNAERLLERAEGQLDALREFSLDVFPDIEVPDRVGSVIAAAHDQHLTELPEQALRSLVVCVIEAEAAGRAGMVIEAGTALGGSAVAMAAAKDRVRPMRVYGEVSASFARLGVPEAEHGVELVTGALHDTLDIDGPVALAHVGGDCDTPTLLCLERIAPQLVTDGRIVIDDYWTRADCRDTLDDYFADRPGFQVEMRARVHVVRTA